tara:strand:+ start:13806 stop:14267 length:462 start_codon:yes stop_codon:yes gene_type:complete
MYRTYTAFTMIELIAIMVIAGILGTSVVSTYSNYNKWLNINEELQSMVKILENARDYCMAKNEPFYLSINIEDESYTLQYKTSQDALIIPNEVSNVFTLPSYIDISSLSGFNSGNLEFNILGEPTTNNNGVININDGDRKIYIVSPTGYIYVQ